MPNQWRTIAPIIGRTATQCLQHYERLLFVVFFFPSLFPPLHLLVSMFLSLSLIASLLSPLAFVCGKVVGLQFVRCIFRVPLFINLFLFVSFVMLDSVNAIEKPFSFSRFCLFFPFRFLSFSFHVRYLPFV